MSLFINLICASPYKIGVGTKLLNRMYEESRRIFKNEKNIHIFLDPIEKALGFYIKQGFKPISDFFPKDLLDAETESYYFKVLN